MIKKTGIIVLIFFCGSSFSQDLDSLTLGQLALDTLLQDSIDEPPPYYAGVYIFGEALLGPHYRGTNLAAAIGVGLQYKKYILGFSVTEFQGSLEEFVIFPNVFELDYRFAGITVGYELLNSEWISMDVVATHQLGDMVWRNKSSGVNFLRDEFSISSIGLKVDLDRYRYTKPFFRISYQKANNLDLAIVNNGDFDGFVFVFGLQIGYFNQ